MHFGLSEILMRDFAAFENQLDLNTMPLPKKFSGSLNLYINVMLTRAETQTNPLDLDLFLGSSLFAILFILTIEMFAVVHNPAYGRVGLGGNQYKVKTGFLGKLLGFFTSHDPPLLIVLIDKANSWDADTLVCRQSLSDRSKVKNY